jgi:DNA-binding transcriptional LysR family regulator
MIENNRLQVFIQAADTLNFSEAAKILNLSQPTVSHHIRTLESDMGVKLFYRDGPNLRLTETGRFLLPLARKLVRNVISFQELVASVKEDVVGDLRIACSTTAGKYILPRLAARFRHHYPGVRISILRCTREDVDLKLLEGEANLGVVSYESRSKGLEIQEFFEDHISLIVPKSHPWAALASITPDDLIDEPLIIREPQSGTRRVLLTELAKHDIRLDDLNVFLELGNAEAIVDTVSAGYGVSFVSRLSTTCMLENKEIVEVPVEGLTLSRKIYMVRKEIDAPNRPQEVFWSFIHNPENLDLIQMA